MATQQRNRITPATESTTASTVCCDDSDSESLGVVEVGEVEITLVTEDDIVKEEMMLVPMLEVGLGGS